MQSPDSSDSKGARLDERKQALRALVKGRCRLAGEPLDAASRAVQQRLLESGLLERAGVIALYRALASEVKTAALEEALTGRGAGVCYPAVFADERVLRFHSAGGTLRRSPLGFEEPVPAAAGAPGAEVKLEAIDVFIIPGLAADASGRRLGRGRGHYDATLASAPRGLRILLLLDAGLVPEVPVGEHDALLDVVCTESRLLLCTPRARAAARAGQRPGGAR